MQVREAAEEYISLLKQHSKETVTNYTFFLTAFCNWCETQQPVPRLEDIRAKVVNDFLDYRRLAFVARTPGKKEVSSQTLHTYVKIILTFLNWCLEDEKYGQYVKHATVKRIKKPRRDQMVIETFTPEQIKLLFKAAKHEYNEELQIRDRAILAVLMDTGIRANECVTLTIGNTHLDPLDAYIRVHGKGKKWREVGLGERAQEEIKTYIKLYRQDALGSESLFINRYSKPLTPDGLHQLVHRLGVWSEISGVRCSPHTFRHTFAIQYLLQGGDVYMLSRLMGHTSVQVTEIYLRAVKAIQARKSSKSVLDRL